MPSERPNVSFVPGVTSVQSKPAVLQSTKTTVGMERPLAITIVCIVLGIFLALNLFGLLEALLLFIYNPLGIGIVIAISLIIQLLAFVVIYGYWMMHKWAVYLYTAIFIVALVLRIQTIVMSPATLFNLGTLLAVIVISVGFKYIDQMS
jgi:hypothetical protein